MYSEIFFFLFLNLFWISQKQLYICTRLRGVAQPGYRACFGSRRPQVRILPPRQKSFHFLEKAFFCIKLKFQSHSGLISKTLKRAKKTTTENTKFFKDSKFSKNTKFTKLCGLRFCKHNSNLRELCESRQLSGLRSLR